MRKHHSIILPNDFQHTDHIRHFNINPSLIIFDISCIDFHFDSHLPFYNKYNPRDIIETVASVPIYSDYDYAVLNEIESRFTIEELDQFDFDFTDLLVSNVVTWFYEYLNTYLPDNVDNYLFACWLDKYHNEIMMKKHDLY